VNIQYGNVQGKGRAHSEPEDCDVMFSGGVRCVAFTAVVLYEIMQRKQLRATGKKGRKRKEEINRKE